LGIPVVHVEYLSRGNCVCVRSCIGASSYKFYATTNFAGNNALPLGKGELSHSILSILLLKSGRNFATTSATGLWKGYDSPSFGVLPRPEDLYY
jgi:hypothetical protein